MSDHVVEALRMAHEGQAQGELEKLRNENFTLRSSLEAMATRLAEVETQLVAKPATLYVGGRKND